MKTIRSSRQYGSGGRHIAALLSEKMGVPCYDSKLLLKEAERHGISQEIINECKGKTSLVYAIGVMMSEESQDKKRLTIPEKMFHAQKETVKRLAQEGPCIFVGRCADYVLKDNPNVVSVFVHADEKFCLDRAMERNSMTEKEMKKYIEKTDKFRGDFYRYHTGHEWADARNYDLCLNSGKLGFQKCVEEIKAYIKIRFDL